MSLVSRQTVPFTDSMCLFRNWWASGAEPGSEWESDLCPLPPLWRHGMFPTPSFPRLRCSPTKAGAICQPRHNIPPPSPLLRSCKWKRRVPSFIFPRIFVTPLPDICAYHLCALPAYCVPRCSRLRAPKAGSAVLVFNSSRCLLCSVVCWIAAVLSRKVSSVLTLLSDWNVTCYVGNIATLIWLLGLVFCHAVYNSKGPGFLINSFSNKLISKYMFSSGPFLLRNVIYIQTYSKNVRKMYLAESILTGT